MQHLIRAICQKGKWPISQCGQNIFEVRLKYLFSGEARDILLRQSRLAQFLQHLAAKALLLVNPTELEIF